jgi:hypothetical protein
MHMVLKNKISRMPIPDHQKELHAFQWFEMETWVQVETKQLTIEDIPG